MLFVIVWVFLFFVLFLVSGFCFMCCFILLMFCLIVFDMLVWYMLFIKVVNELYMMQGVVSCQVVILEEYFNVKLFECINCCLIFIEVGCDYVGQVFIILKQIEMVIFQVMIYNSLVSVLNLVILLIFGVKWLILCLVKFVVVYFDVLLNLSMEVLFFDFNMCQVDVVIYFGEFDWFDIVMVWLMGEEVVLVCSKVLVEGLGLVGDLVNVMLFQYIMCLQVWQDWFCYVGVDCFNVLLGLCFE